MMEQPITELSNPLSYNIDKASPKEIAEILYACDLEIFYGWNETKGVRDENVINKIEQLAHKISEVIENACGAVVISGCGTSGRIAFLTARTFNKYLKSKGGNECFHYIIAGDDRALFTSLELAEDDPVVGAYRLQQLCQNKTDVVYIGVTCGLSAPFVAGQLDYTLSHLDIYTPVLIGFNPVHQARNLKIEKWDKTFFQVVQELEKAENSSKAYILNPIIGPEPITGSSRMKSGTTTRILLEILSLKAIHRQLSISELISMYESACHSVYKYTDDLGSMIDLAGASLTSGGHVFYLGCDGFGLMAMIDASECPPTYGASFHDMRGFVDGGFSALLNNDGDLSSQGPQYKISIEDFERDIVPSLASSDLVVFLGEDILHKVSESIFSAPCKRVFVSCYWPNNVPTTTTRSFSLSLVLELDVAKLASLNSDPLKALITKLLEEVSLKWVVNNLSTGAHILKGKVCQNKMVDVKVSNNKLFHRAVGIVQNYSSLSVEECTTILLKSIYDTDSLTADQESASVVAHIEVASCKDMVVPTAIVIASLGCNVSEAKEMLKSQPVLRKLVCALVN
ncbi:unnamed protein product [Lymnaea stagnalis]|uniref:SIS domain-containing protein n=1 Tax=Lymnaea stagnalis TaxID=6523 RepID=A0AAV2I5S4_LYMST